MFKTTEQALEAQKKSLDKIRTPELKRAWEDQETIRQMYLNGVRVSEIARHYKINPRSCYRIINL